MIVSDVMSRALVTVMPGHSVKHAAQIMLDHHVSGLPVVDDTGRLVGMLTEGDLLRRVEYGLAGGRPHWLEASSPQGAARDYIKSHSWRVGDVMSKPVVSIKEDALLADAAVIFGTHSIKRLPVMRNGQLVGIISRADLLNLIASTMPEIVTGGDDAIRTSAETRLRDATTIFAKRPNVTVERGIIHLWGRVRSQAERDAARVACESVHGINGVEDHLTIAATD